jgi:CRP/FNR family transcriptional regulator, anaerobic regulatory protein
MLDEPRLRFARERLSFWDKLALPERSALESSISELNVKKGARLRSSDSECLGVLIVRAGELRAYIQSEDGREVTLYKLGPGEVCVLSASCILNSIDFDVMISAAADSEVLRVGIGAFEDVMRHNVWAENFAYKSAVERFSDVMWAVEQILFMRFDRRLAAYLLDASRADAGGAVHATHEEIALDVGSAREVVSRMLKHFETQGWVGLTRGSVQVLDRAALKRL